MCPRNLPGSVRRHLYPVSGLNLEIILPYLASRAQKESLSLSTPNVAQTQSTLVSLGAAGLVPQDQGHGEGRAAVAVSTGQP